MKTIFKQLTKITGAYAMATLLCPLSEAAGNASLDYDSKNTTEEMAMPLQQLLDQINTATSINQNVEPSKNANNRVNGRVSGSVWNVDSSVFEVTDPWEPIR